MAKAWFARIPLTLTRVEGRPQLAAGELFGKHAEYSEDDMKQFEEQELVYQADAPTKAEQQKAEAAK